MILFIDFACEAVTIVRSGYLNKSLESVSL